MAVLCALANPATSAYLPPTPGHCGFSSCGSSKLSHSKCQGRLGLSLLLLALPWGSPTSSHHSEAFWCSWHSPACCSHHSFCMVKPQQPQLCPWEGQESSVVPVTQVLLACVNRHILASSARQVMLPSLGFFWLLKQWAGKWMRFSSMYDNLDSHSCFRVQIGGLSTAFCFLHENSCSIGGTVLGLQSTHCSGVWLAQRPCPRRDGAVSQPWKA